MRGKVLVIDDEELLREDLKSIISKEGFDCRTAQDGDSGIRTAAEWEPDIILCDLVMPGKSGMDTVAEIACLSPDACMIMMTAFASVDTAVASFRKGVSDYLMKPLNVDELLQKLRRWIRMKTLLAEVRYHRRRLFPDIEFFSHMIGRSDSMRRVFEWIEKVAQVPTTVLISGESGTGKELAARAIHERSPYQEGPFIAVNCAALPDSLLESELFGYVRGAFTGAHQDKRGFFELAHEGTLFLDEVSEIPIHTQAKLLRALEEKEISPLGGTRSVRIEARIIASTNQDLKQSVSHGKFRDDLFFRLQVVEITLPPLRARKEDIPLLIEYFVKKYSEELKKPCFGVDGAALKSLLCYHWPGNVRELRNVMERSVIVAEGDLIRQNDLPHEIVAARAGEEYSEKLRESVRIYEREHIRQVLRLSGGNREQTAHRLGINPATLYRKISDLQIKDA